MDFKTHPNDLLTSSGLQHAKLPRMCLQKFVESSQFLLFEVREVHQLVEDQDASSRVRLKLPKKVGFEFELLGTFHQLNESNRVINTLSSRRYKLPPFFSILSLQHPSICAATSSILCAPTSCHVVYQYTCLLAGRGPSQIRPPRQIRRGHNPQEWTKARPACIVWSNYYDMVSGDRLLHWTVGDRVTQPTAAIV